MDGPQAHALADRLERQITASPVVAVDVPSHRWQANVLLTNCVGQVIQRVWAYGHWVAFDFSHGFSWLMQLPPRCRWKLAVVPAEAPTGTVAGKPQKRLPLLRVTLQKGLVAALYGNPAFYIVPTQELWKHPQMQNLGPDPIAEEFQAADFLRGLQANLTKTVAGALLDSSIVAGVGNRLKCEVLHALRLAPTARLRNLMGSELAGLVQTTTTLARQMYKTQQNHEHDIYPYRVYNRAGETCLSCGEPVVVDRSGGDGHWTWYCPACQTKGRDATLFEGLPIFAQTMQPTLGLRAAE
jgi:endonuclease-8